MRPELCAERSARAGEPVGATASRADHWLLVEYRGRWERDVVGGSRLAPDVKDHLRAAVAARPRTRLLFVRRSERRDHPGLAVLAGTTGGPFRGLEVDRHEDLLGLDLAAGIPAAPVLEPFFVVCTHGTRDRCCAKFGRPLYEAVRRHAGAERVWQCSHVGGDRFAGNLVAFPHGLFFGHVEPGEAGPILDRLAAGAIDLRRYRGRCDWPFAAQAADLAVREETGIDAIGAFSLLSVEPAGEGAWTVALAGPGGERREVEVVAEPAAEEAYLTCAADRPQRFTRVRAAR